ncbi:TPA: hypothetical protein QCU60_001283 [Bacillus cereus]|nr:hypothetical protein [Bacillus cereus]
MGIILVNKKFYLLDPKGVELKKNSIDFRYNIQTTLSSSIHNLRKTERKVYNKGNVAVAQFIFNDFIQTLYSHSQIDYPTDPYLHYAKEDNLFASSCAILRKDKIFTTLELSSKDSLLPYDRCVDTEAKLLEQIRFLADTFKPAEGIVNLFTELYPCTSCKNVIDQFEKRYNGNITLNVFYEK